MRMAAQREIDAEAHRLPENYRIVREQQLHFIRERTAESRWQIGFADHMIVHAGEPKRSSAGFKAKAFVDQNIDSPITEKPRDEKGVRPVIVVSEACKCTEFRPQFPQNPGDRCDEPGFVRDVVSGENKHVRPQAIGYFYRPGDVFEASKWAVMRVG